MKINIEAYVSIQISEEEPLFFFFFSPVQLFQLRLSEIIHISFQCLTVE